MKTNKLLAVLLLVGVAFSTLTSCQKELPQTPPQTLPASGVVQDFKIITACDALGVPGDWSMKGSIFYLYSDVFPILLLDGFTVTIHSDVDPNLLMFYHPDGDSVSHSVTIPKNIVLEVGSINNGPYLPNCDIENGTYMGICYKLPKSDCVISFCLEIQSLRLGLKYRTPFYYYIISGHPTASGRYFATIKDIYTEK